MRTAVDWSPALVNHKKRGRRGPGCMARASIVGCESTAGSPGKSTPILPISSRARGAQTRHARDGIRWDEERFDAARRHVVPAARWDEARSDEAPKHAAPEAGSHGAPVRYGC